MRPTLRQRHAQMLDKLGATDGRIEARFSFFLRKRAPVSGLTSLLDYQGRWIAETRGGVTAVFAEVGVPVKSLCPCSKEISDYGAHNQRSLVTIRVEMLQPIEWQELVRFAEDQASSELWPMLKRVDEKWVTERAYENPKFVEDLVRDVALALNRDARIGRYRVRGGELRVDPQPQRLRLHRALSFPGISQCRRIRPLPRSMTRCACAAPAPTCCRWR